MKIKEKYEKLLKEMKEDFIKKDVVVECIYSSDGSLCYLECNKFGDCWVVKSKLEKKLE